MHNIGVMSFAVLSSRACYTGKTERTGYINFTLGHHTEVVKRSSYNKGFTLSAGVLLRKLLMESTSKPPIARIITPYHTH